LREDSLAIEKKAARLKKCFELQTLYLRLSVVKESSIDRIFFALVRGHSNTFDPLNMQKKFSPPLNQLKKKKKSVAIFNNRKVQPE